MSTTNPSRASSSKWTLAVNRKIEGQPLRRFMFVVVFSLLSLMGGTRAFGAAEVVRGKLVSVTEPAPRTFDYAFALVVSNGAPALNSATITASTRSREIKVIQGQVSLGPIPANSETVTAGTIVLQVHERDDDYFENLSFTVVPGPGPVAEAQISGATGGTIVVNDPGDPVLGTQITFPPGIFSDNETITIGYSDSLPGPLPTDAIAAGVIPVSKVINLSRTGTEPFLNTVAVTIPYNLQSLGSEDFPAVANWEPTLTAYQADRISSVDRQHGLVTFMTKHFSSHTSFGLPGLSQMLIKQIPYSQAASAVDTGFRPGIDGFEVLNISGAVPDTNRGVCWGVSSYTAWYYTALMANTLPAGMTHLFQQYRTPADKNIPHLPEEDAVAREIIAKTYVDTVHGGPFGSIPSPLPLISAGNFTLQMYLTHSPQLVYLLDSSGTVAHSVLVYAWNAQSESFSVYDPNLPYPATNPHIVWNPSSQSFDPYLIYSEIDFDAYGEYYRPEWSPPLAFVSGPVSLDCSQSSRAHV